MTQAWDCGVLATLSPFPPLLSSGSCRGQAPHCQRIKHPRLRSQPALPQHCIYWRLLFTQAHDRSSDPHEKSHPLLILPRVSGAWQTFIKEPQHGATARPFFLLPFFYLLSHPPPRGGGARGRRVWGLAEVTPRAAERQGVESRDAFVCGLFL